MSIPPLRLIALEVTRRCILACRHCRGDSRDCDYGDELTFDEITRIIDSAASFANPILIITGGEPLTRPDVCDIARYAVGRGLRPVLATCGHLLTDAVARELKEAGIARISVSIDGASAAAHDDFRGVPGAFRRTIEGIAAARRQGLAFQVNSTITTLNAGELEALHDLAVELGAEAFHPFLLVPMGRGSELADKALSPDAYEALLHRIADLAAVSPLDIKPTCSPHYQRVIRERKSADPAHPASGHHGQPPALGARPASKGCLGGQGFVFISHRGAVQLCGFLELPAGDLRSGELDLKRIWEESELFRLVRDTDGYHGSCGICEFRLVCGGCRARAFAATGDVLGPEPSCVHEPKGHLS